MAQEPAREDRSRKVTSLAAGRPGRVAHRTGAAADGLDSVAGARQERLAAEDEARRALRLGVVAVPPVLAIAAMALGNSRGWLEATVVLGEPRAVQLSLLSIVLVLVSGQLVVATLALEHLASGPGSDSDDADPVMLVWLARGLVVLAVVAAVLVPYTEVRRWGTVGWSALAVESVAVGVLLLVTWLSSRRAGPGEPPGATGPQAGDGTGAALLGDVDEPGWQDGGDQILAIGASGGGIRAAAFVLGGHQAVQDAATARDRDPAGSGVADAAQDVDPEDRHEPHVFAVSGGSYAAAALALRRTYDIDGRRREQPTPWRTAYASGSPEVERLRRHTRYLFEPPGRTRDGVVSLVMGAVVHLAIVGAALRFVTWASSQLALTLGIVELDRVPTGDGWEARSLRLAQSWDWSVQVAVLLVPAVCLAVVVQLTASGWRGTSAFDSDEASQDTTEGARSSATRGLDKLAKLRPALLTIAAGWLLLLVGLPAASVGIVDLTTSNRPTATTSTALRALGFANPTMCTESFVQRVEATVDRLNIEGRISPDVAHAGDAGACGVETTVVRTVVSNGDADPGNDVVVPADTEAARLLASDNLLAWQVAGLGALFLGVIALLRHGPSPEQSVAAGWLARFKRVLLTWLPLLIVGLVGLYLTLWWTYGFLTELGTSYTAAAALTTAAACALAYAVDANATSMHGFYRSRLSDAFAVGIDEATGRTAELPVQNVYRFSEMAGTGPHPRLHVVATLNSQACNEAPTMRGGFPMIFGADEVSVHREERRSWRIPTAAYERFAGPGRVSVMASVAVSGAAISPLMGRYATQMAPYRLLLALFNLRLGTWVRNPLHTHDTSTERQLRAGGLWMTWKPGLVQVLGEAIGRTSADRRWIYLSDGGHLDNTGLVECVRYCRDRRVRGRILVLDASNDPVDSWSAVGDAIGVVRADLGLDLRRETPVDEPPWMRRYADENLTVIVVKAVRTDPPPADGPTAGRTDWYAKLPPNVHSFQMVRKDFPRASTARQKFGDLEFEAYRSLGYAATAAALACVEGAGDC